jgi:tetratricopeptide (TPR) repeat protein
MLEQAIDSALEQFDFESAEKLLLQGISADGNNPNLLEKLADVYIDSGNLESAHSILSKVVEIAPSANAWLNLAELCGGNDSVCAYLNGIELLKKEEQIDLDRLCSAFCALVELYETDLCDQEDAEEKCEFFVDQAVGLNYRNSEVLYTIANLRFIQDRIEEANSLMNEFMEIYRQDEQLSEGNQSKIGYEIRVSASKLLADLGMFEMCAELLEQLLAEDDRDLELWYMCGIAYCGFEPETAREYFEALIERAEKEKNQELIEMARQAMSSLPEMQEGEDSERMDV